jgi:peptide chain release factor subunit 1
MSNPSNNNGDETDNADDLYEQQQLQAWKTKRLIQFLENARGEGTSMISLIVSPNTEVSKVSQMLTTEYGTASNIKSRVNRQSVQDAITTTQNRLKLYNYIGDTGLCIYCGTIVTDEGKEKLITIDFIPQRPLGTSMYLCDSRFQVEPLKVLLTSEEKYGFIVMDGLGSLFGTLCGSAKEILTKFSVDLPKKHGRGGQSAQRFGRLRLEKRHNYIRKVAETAVPLFITNDVPNVKGLVLAGSAEFKSMLLISDLFDPRLKKIVIKVVDTSYGGENGFNQAIELAQEALADTKFVHEKKIIEKFFDHIARDTGEICFGIHDVTEALDMGSVDTLILWEELDLLRCVFNNPQGQTESEKTKILYLKPSQLLEEIKDPVSGVDLKLEESMNYVEWLSEKRERRKGAKLELVSNKSQDGAQFVVGFGGVGALLRWKVTFDHAINVPDGDEADEWDSDF